MLLLFREYHINIAYNKMMNIKIIRQKPIPKRHKSDSLMNGQTGWMNETHDDDESIDRMDELLQGPH